MALGSSGHEVKDFRQARGDRTICADLQYIAARSRPTEPVRDRRQIGPAGFGNPRLQCTGPQADLDGCQGRPAVNEEHVGLLGVGQPAQSLPHGRPTERGVQNYRPLVAQLVPGALQQTIVDLAGRRGGVTGRWNGVVATPAVGLAEASAAFDVGTVGRGRQRLRQTPRQGAFARGGQPAQRKDHRPFQPGGIRRRQAQIAAGVLPINCLAIILRTRLLPVDGVDLAAHHGTVALIERPQCQTTGIFAAFCIGLHDQVGVVREALVVEVHGQEGQVGNDVDPAQVVVEFDAVDDLNAAVAAKIDVVAAQVAVTSAHMTVFDTVQEKRLVGLQVLLGCAVDPVQPGTIPQAGGRCCGLPDILATRRANAEPDVGFRCGRNAGPGGIESEQVFHQLDDLGCRDSPPLQSGAEGVPI